MAYNQIANFEKYTPEVASMIKKAGMDLSAVESSFLPHSERFPTGDMNLHLVSRKLAENLGGPDYMEKLKADPCYIWRELQRNPDKIGFVNVKRIAVKKLPISMIVDAEIASVCREAIYGPRKIKVRLNPNLVSSAYEKDDPFNASHSQEHAMENRLRLGEI